MMPTITETIWKGNYTTLEEDFYLLLKNTVCDTQLSSFTNNFKIPYCTSDFTGPKHEINNLQSAYQTYD